MKPHEILQERQAECKEVLLPGNFRRIPPRPGKIAPGKPAIQRGTAMKRPSLPRPAPSPPIQRPVANALRRATNLNRMAQRNQRREEVGKIADQVSNRPRPAVRPPAPPRRVMPNNQPPGKVQLAGRARAAVTPPRPPRPQDPNLSRQAPRSPVGLGAGVVAAGAAAAVAGRLALQTAGAHPDLSAEVAALERDLGTLESASALTEVQADVTNLDSVLNNALASLESARAKGYRYGKDLEETAYGAMSQWEALRPQIESTIYIQSQTMQNRLGSLDFQIARLNGALSNPRSAAPLLQATHARVNELLRAAQGVEHDLENSYSQIETQAQQVNARLADIHWALGQLSEAKFKFETGEDLVMAVRARWDKEGKDDPEGVLYLSNRRLVFERKEKVATKKILFITTASEQVQEVLVDQPLKDITEIKAANRGLFGHHDYLEAKFAERGLGVVLLHIDGQDSKNWVELLERTRSGEIEADRVGEGGLASADMGKAITNSNLVSLQNEVNELQDEMMLKAVRQELAELENEISSLERKLAGVRAQGYVIERGLEADQAVLAAQWERIKTNVEKTLNGQAGALGEKMDAIQESLAQLVGMAGNLATARPVYLELKSAIASAEAQADAAAATVLAQYDAYADEIGTFNAHLEWIDWMLEALSTASFRLLATESGVAATEAQWLAPGREPENGVLFLTDQRLLWEDRVSAYELKLDVPLHQLVEVQKECAEAGETEYLACTFGPDVPHTDARFQMALPVAESWLKMIGRARAGDYSQDRAIPLDPAELERVRNAPSQCPNCGAVLSAPILRGQREITCEYCGRVTRL